MTIKATHMGVHYTLAIRSDAKRGRYTLKFTHNGERIRESTGHTDADQAHQYARSFIDAHLKGGRFEAWTLHQAVEATFALRWRGKPSESTFRLNCNLLLRYFGMETKVTDITLEKYIDFVTWMQARGASDSTLNKKTSNLRVILKTAANAGKLPDGVIDLPHRKEGKGRVRYMSDGEEATLDHYLRQCGAEVVADYIQFMTDTGLRRGEALKLEPRDVTLDGTMIHLWETKTDSPRSIPLSKRASSIVKKYSDKGRTYIWHGGADTLGDNATTAGYTIRTWWDRAAGAMGLSEDTQWVPYVTRHTCATRLVAGGLHLRKVMEWMGHRNISTTLVYAHLEVNSLADGVNILDGRGRAEPEALPPAPALRLVK